MLGVGQLYTASSGTGFFVNLCCPLAILFRSSYKCGSTLIWNLSWFCFLLKKIIKLEPEKGIFSLNLSSVCVIYRYLLYVVSWSQKEMESEVTSEMLEKMLPLPRLVDISTKKNIRKKGKIGKKSPRTIGLFGKSHV